MFEPPAVLRDLVRGEVGTGRQKPIQIAAACRHGGGSCFARLTQCFDLRRQFLPLAAGESST